MVIAAIAYQHLTNKARTEANRLLQIGGTDRTRDFYSAACWADDIRRERRETGPWHYIDLHFRTDGKSVTNKPDAENAVWAIEKFRAILADKTQPDADRADALRFLLHFVGDIHQPLHAVSWDSDQLPQGDAGGNKFPILPPPLASDDRPPHNLHALWDLGCGLFPSTGRDFRPLQSSGRQEIDAIRDKIERDHPFNKGFISDMKPMDWAQSGLRASKEVVYTLPMNSIPSPSYLQKGRERSELRAAEAGYRLAELLNETLK
jgi:hypothetical protein